MKNKRIVFIGSAGSGKSTFVKFVKKKLEKKGFVVNVKFMGWRNFENPLVKFLSRNHLRYKLEKSDKNRLERYKNRSFLFYLIYYLELWSRYLKFKKIDGDFILMDRYFYDELSFASKFKKRFFGLITPKPELCLVLRTNSETLIKRKRNINEKDLDKFYNKLYKTANVGMMIKVDSSKNLNEMYRKIKKFLVK